MTQRLQCPRCSTVIAVPFGVDPLCPKCGFNGTAIATPPPHHAAPHMTPPATAAHPYVPTGARPPQPAGKPRSYGVSLLLGIVTFGIYFLVYNYKVYGEVDRQHGREHHQLWFWLSIFFWFFDIAYQVKEIPQLQSYRTQRGLPEGITTAYFLLWKYLGAFILVGPFIAYYRLNRVTAELWNVIYAEYGLSTQR